MCRDEAEMVGSTHLVGFGLLKKPMAKYGKIKVLSPKPIPKPRWVKILH